MRWKCCGIAKIHTVRELSSKLEKVTHDEDRNVEDRLNKQRQRMYFLTKRLVCWKNVEDKTRFLQNIFLFETLAIAITLKFDIDNQNSHIWKEIRFPSHYLWYLFWFSGVYYYMLTWIFRGELGSHERGEVMMVGSVFYELGRWSYIMTFTERNSSCACNKLGGNWKGGRGVRRGVLGEVSGEVFLFGCVSRIY